MSGTSLDESDYLEIARGKLAELMKEKHLDNKLRPLTQSEIISANRKLADMKNPLGAVVQKSWRFY